MFEILIYIFKGIFQLLMWTWWIIVPIIAIISFQNFRKSKWVDNVENVVLGVKIPKNSEKGPVSAEMMFASLHGILKPNKDIKKEGSIQEHLSFEMVADSKSIMFYVWTPKHLQNFVEGQIYSQYPTAEIAVVPDYTKNVDIDNDGKEDYVASCELKLIKPDYYPIKTFVSFEVDPLAGITGALSKIEDRAEKMWIQILTRPVQDTWRNKGLAYAEGMKNGSGPKLFTKSGMQNGLLQLPGILIGELFNAIFPTDEKGGKSVGSTKQITHNQETALACLEEKANKLGYQVKIRIMYIAKTKELAVQHLRITSGAFKQFNTAVANGFVPTKIRTGEHVLDEYRARLFADKGFVLNIEEVASLYHLPHASVETPNIVWTSSKKGEPPANLPYADDPNLDKKDLTVFAETTFRGQLKQFGIKKDDRRRHMYILGKSGAGKSKLLELLAVADIERGEGVGIVDPHGELIHDVLKKIPSHRINDVVYINPADKDFPVGFNPMKATPELREGVASGFVSVFKKQFGYSWGPRLEYLMRYAILALTYYPDTTMLDVVKILTDKDYRKKVLTYVEDPVVKTFWLKEFSTYNDKFATEAVAPILNKVGQFTASPTIRNIIGQTKETFDFEDAMNSQKIILVDLSSGKIGEDNSELLGSLMITKMQLSAMARAKLKPEDRKDFFLYVDEFQNFATESFAKILSEARKYRLSLILANQYVAQMEETVRDAVFGNVGSLISFRVGATDATYLEKEFSPTFEKDDLIGLDNQHMYLNMLIDGVASNSFSAKSLFVGEGSGENVDKIIALSREKYASPREEIEEQIRKWSNVDNLDVEATIDRQKDSKFDGNDYVRNTSSKDSKRPMTRTDAQKSLTDKPMAPTRPVYAPNRETSRPNTTQASHGQQRSGEAVPIKKSVDPEELKKIIQNLTRPTEKKEKVAEVKNEQGSEKTIATGPIVNKEKSTLLTGTLHVDKKEDEEIRPVEILHDKKISMPHVEPKPIEPIMKEDTKPSINPIITPPSNAPVFKHEKVVHDSKPQLKSKTPIIHSVPRPRIQPQSNTQTAPLYNTRPQIQRPVESTPVKEQQRVAPVVPVVKPINPNVQTQVPRPIVINKFKNNFIEAEDETVRKITREEFLDLKEIQPNEKIIIVDRKEGESQIEKKVEESMNNNNATPQSTSTNPPTSPSTSQEKNQSELKPGDTVYFDK